MGYRDTQIDFVKSLLTACSKIIRQHKPSRSTATPFYRIYQVVLLLLTSPDIKTHLSCFCFQLREAGVVDMDEDEFCVTPTPQGVLFSRFMVRFDSMKAIMSVSEETGIK